MTRKNNDRLLWLLLIGIGAFNKADFMLTHIAISEGYQEANPIINAVLDTWGFPFLKLLVVPAILVGLWMIRRRLNQRMIGYVWVGFIAYFMLMVHFKRLLFPGFPI
ncbi:MAG: DUF5658 family protein [Bacillota bacterium]|nr:DUF5658 family protein [Bacillota bacterium]MDW7678560.1 DUF5658 family protein [Bacillota bacterium]